MIEETEEEEEIVSGELVHLLNADNAWRPERALVSRRCGIGIPGEKGKLKQVLDYDHSLRTTVQQGGKS